MSAKVNGLDSAPDIAANAAGELFKNSGGAVAIIGSGRSTVEEQFLTKKLATALKASTYLVSRVGQGDGILISADRNPNVRGALVVGLISALPKVGDATPPSHSDHRGEGAAAPSGINLGGLGELAAAIDAGKVKTVVSVGEDLTAAGLSAAHLAKISVIYLGTHANATSAAAKVIFPTLTVFEKNGTFVNQQFRVQKFHQAVPAPAGVTDDLAALTKLVTAAGGPTLSSDVRELWKTLAAEVPALGTMAFGNLPETGLLLDATPWAALPFAEGETLHYKPAAKTATATA